MTIPHNTINECNLLCQIMEYSCDNPIKSNAPTINPYLIMLILQTIKKRCPPHHDHPSHIVFTIGCLNDEKGHNYSSCGTIAVEEARMENQEKFEIIFSCKDTARNVVDQ